MPTREELCNALSIISKVCSMNTTCVNCPLGTSLGICMLQKNNTPPFRWEIKEPPKLDVWRVF